MTSISAKLLVNVNPSVVTAGGNGIALTGLLLTNGTRVPIGSVLSFPNDGESVSNYFGPGATETALATVYFNGFEDSQQKPASILFGQYNTAAVSGYLRGGPVGSQLTLAQLQAVATGTLTLSIAGTPITSGTINLSAATSFSNAATIIQTAFTTPPFAVTYDSVAQAFVFTTTATGATATVTYCTTNALATALDLTAAKGAVLSQGAAIAVPGTYMDALVQQTQAWATFMTTFDPDVSGNANKQLFAAWVNAQNNRYAYVAWDTDITPTQSNNATASLGNILEAADSSGTFCVYDPANGATIAAFVCGAAASIDFTDLNGRITFAYRRQNGLTAGVTTATAGTNLIANGYNFYGDYATADTQFLFLQPGQITGPYDWMDSYLDQVWLNGALQLALLTLLQNQFSIPYNDQGYEQIKMACADPINAALNFGAIRAGVALSASQAAQVNAAAGLKISDALTAVGWYLQVVPATSATRIARQSPPINLWYTDGQSVQQITLNSYLVQ